MSGIQEAMWSGREVNDADMAYERNPHGCDLPEPYSDYGRVLTEKAGLVCMKDERGDWIKVIKHWMAKGYKPAYVEQAVAGCRAAGMTIARPGSLTWWMDADAARRRTAPAEMRGQAVQDAVDKLRGRR